MIYAPIPIATFNGLVIYMDALEAFELSVLLAILTIVALVTLIRECAIRLKSDYEWLRQTMKPPAA